MSDTYENHLGPMICAIPVEVSPATTNRVEFTMTNTSQLRLIIFEFAVKLDKPVAPRQITEHSNKFTWGDRKQVPVHDHPGNRDYVWECQETEPLAIVSLNLTCKQFYEELRDYPVFYRVNEFHFEIEDLVPYLAAITPQRRSTIQKISVNGGGRSKTRRSAAMHKHAVTLLSQCAALRTVQPSKVARSLQKDFSSRDVQRAIDFGRLDINGADRAGGYCPVEVFTHTRFEVLKQKKLDATMDYRLGTLKKELLPRYDTEGRLLWRVQEIISIRRGSRGPKCQVKWWTTTADTDATEWEDASSLMSAEGLELFRKFYDSNGEKFRAIPKSTTSKYELDAEFNRFLAIPAPDEIQALKLDIFERKRALQSRWRRLQKDYQRTEYMLKAYYHLASEKEQDDCQKKRPARNAHAETRPTKRVKIQASRVYMGETQDLV